MIVTMEEQHVYICNHSATDRISWRVNGSVLNHEIFPKNITSDSISLPEGGRIHKLTIGGHSEHNGTTIQCSAVFVNGSIPEVIHMVAFYTQGQLHVVSLILDACIYHNTLLKDHYQV